MCPSPLRFPLVLAWISVVAAGLLAGIWSHRRERSARLDDLQVDASRCALAIDAAAVAGLSGTREDLEAPAYREAKRRLVQLHAVHPDVRFVSIFRWDPSRGAVVYLADSEPVDSSQLSLPGDVFPEAPLMPGLRSILKDGRPSTEGPIEDSFGVFVTGYAQIGEARETALGTARDVIALDVTMRTWNRELLDAGITSAVYVWLLAGVPLGVLTVLRRHSRRRPA